MFLSYRQMDLLAWCHLFKTAIKMDYKKYKFVNCYPVTIIFYHFFFFFTSFLTFYILCVSSQVITENIRLHKKEKKYMKLQVYMTDSTFTLFLMSEGSFSVMLFFVIWICWMTKGRRSAKLILTLICLYAINYFCFIGRNLECPSFWVLKHRVFCECSSKETQQTD